ncbi:P-loop containing nucleoside triphosphate hydrolase protein [Durotheca rogersii]|uniref:P-loop containing nucleoside triphosphate hydrolase protein n=1 Tax=Durotheca rogersii TaxID=419775 RepID=UPI00221EDBCB|nr:P-loop containing nucleoside triphosphate hydrolase protein [Durotheca rogersii]KAI5861945.1 P-loop containing nucleoside triphosphate hydrolase protein [Durotheca rogersii]
MYLTFDWTLEPKSTSAFTGHDSGQGSIRSREIATFTGPTPDSTPARPLIQDYNRIRFGIYGGANTVEGRIDGFRQQLDAILGIVDEVLGCQRSLQGEISPATKEAYKEQGKQRNPLDKHCDQNVARAIEYRKDPETNVSGHCSKLEGTRGEDRGSLQRVRDAENEAGNSQLGTDEREYSIKGKSKNSDLHDELDPASTEGRILNKQLQCDNVAKRRYPTECGPTDAKVSDRVECVKREIVDSFHRELEEREAWEKDHRMKICEISRLHTLLDKTQTAAQEISESQPGTTREIPDLMTGLYEFKRKLFKALSAHLEQLIICSEKHQGDFEYMVKKHQQELDQASRNAQALFDTHIKQCEKGFEERRGKWEANVRMLYIQLQETKKMHHDVSDELSSEKKLHEEELQTGTSSKDAKIQELSLQNQDDNPNLNINPEELIRLFKKEVENIRTVKEKSSQLRRVQDGHEKRFADMRTRLEAEIARLQWKHEEDLITYLREIETLEVENARLAEDFDADKRGIQGQMRDMQVDFEAKLQEKQAAIQTLEAEVRHTQAALAAEKSLFETKQQELEREKHSSNTALSKAWDAKINMLSDRLLAEESRRHRLFEEFQKLRGAIRVVCRIRPVDEGELLNYKEERSDFHDLPAKLKFKEYGTEIHGGPKARWTPTHEFERVFLPSNTNADVFDEVDHFVQAFLDGKRACVVCYGQSGTGKTYTMSHHEEPPPGQGGGVAEHATGDGIIPRVRTRLFAELARLAALGLDADAAGACYEIYNGELCQLKPDGSSEKKLVSKTDHTLVNPDPTPLRNPADFDALVTAGAGARHVAYTPLNASSSRSHLIIRLEIRVRDGGGKLREGLLDLVDLGGAERAAQAGTISRGSAAAARLHEGKQINMSLTELERIFVAMAAGDRVPVSGNTLAQLLARSLCSRECATLMLVTISLLRKDWPATKHTLSFAAKARAAKRRWMKGSGNAKPAVAEGRGKG